MILNGVMAIILRYFAEFCSFRGQLRQWLISHQQVLGRVKMRDRNMRD